jgi:hypothetical protein
MLVILAQFGSPVTFIASYKGVRGLLSWNGIPRADEFVKEIVVGGVDEATAVRLIALPKQIAELSTDAVKVGFAFTPNWKFAVAEQPLASLYTKVIVVVPEVRPVIRPVLELILATPVLLLVHVPIPPPGDVVAVNVVVLPTHIADDPAKLTEGGANTVTVVDTGVP